MGNLRKRQQVLQRLLDNMAAITLEALAHSYLKKPKVDADYALKKIAVSYTHLTLPTIYTV